MLNRLLVLLSISWSSVVSAAAVPSLDLSALTRDADVIAVGTIATVEVLGNSTILLESGAAVPAKDARATMAVDQILKGPSTIAGVNIRFDLAEALVGHRGVAAGEYIVVFLREREGIYEFVSPYYPGISAVPGALGRGADAFTSVLNLFANGLQMPAPTWVKIDMLVAIRGIDSPITIGGLNAISNDPDPEIRLTAINYLLWINQLHALPMAEAVLADATAFDARLLRNLRSGIARGVRSESAIPVLERLLQFPEAETRRAAAAAMSKIESPLIIQPLVSALEDSDFEVRLNAVRGLAEALDERSLIPSDEGFRADEQRFIAPLRASAANPSR